MSDGSDGEKRHGEERHGEGKSSASLRRRMNGGGRETVVITGASAGVGRATARLFGQQGARVALLARGREGLEAAKREVDAAGGEGLVIPCDVADPEQVEAAAQATEDAFGPIDIWINNAMAAVLARAWNTTPDEFRRVTDVTYLGQVYGALSALKRMRPRDRGSIVFVGSVLAYRGIPLQSSYCAAKHAVQGFLDSLRSELLSEGSNVRVSMVQLPGLNTPQFDWVETRLPRKPQPVPPVYQPEVAARAIHWAAHHGRREITVGGRATAILWGNKILPNVGDHYLAATGIESQMREEPVEADRRSNLWEPVPGDAGAHGAFDAIAHERSVHLWANTHRTLVALGAGVIAGAAALAVRAARRGEGRLR